MLFAYFIFWVGCLMACGLVLYNIFKKVVMPRITRKVNKFERLAILKTTTSTTEAYQIEQHLLSLFLQHADTTSFKSSRFTTQVSSILLKKFMEKFFKVQLLSEICEWDRSSCLHFLKLTGNDGTTLYLAGQTSMFPWVNEHRVLWKKSQDNGLEVPVTDNIFELLYNIHLVHGVGVDENNVAYKDLMALLNMTAVERITIPPTQTRVTNLYRFAHDPNMGYYLQSTPQEIKLYSNDMINKSYNDMPIEYDGETYYRPASAAMQLAETVLKNGRNVFISGTMGSGKTTFARQVIARCVEEEGVRVISIPPSMFNQLQNPAAQAALIDQLSTSVEVSEYVYAEDTWVTRVKKMLNIIYIDEAEVLLSKTESGVHSEIQSFLLPMLDGELRDVLNCQVILVFNKDKSVLNPAIFRSLRGGMEFNVSTISADKARELVEVLKVEHPQWHFDEAKFKKFVYDETHGADGYLYAGAGTTTLADVVSCFYEPSIEDAILAAIRGTEVPKPVVKTPETLPIKITPRKLTPQVLTPNTGTPDLPKVSSIPQEASTVVSHKWKKRRGRRR